MTNNKITDEDIDILMLCPDSCENKDQEDEEGELYCMKCEGRSCFKPIIEGEYVDE